MKTHKGRAVVVVQSKASYLIGVLGMLKVQGSNPGFAIYFINWQSLDKTAEFDHK